MVSRSRGAVLRAMRDAVASAGLRANIGKERGERIGERKRAAFYRRALFLVSSPVTSSCPPNCTIDTCLA